MQRQHVQQPNRRRSGNCSRAISCSSRLPLFTRAPCANSNASHLMSCELQSIEAISTSHVTEDECYFPTPSCTSAQKHGSRSAFDCDISLRVAAQSKTSRAGTTRCIGHLPLSLKLACIYALVVGGVGPAAAGAAICASRSTVRGLSTTSATVGVQASFTIEVRH